MNSFGSECQQAERLGTYSPDSAKAVRTHESNITARAEFGSRSMVVCSWVRESPAEGFKYEALGHNPEDPFSVGLA